MSDGEGTYLGVSSEVSALGTYMCQLTLGDTALRVLDRDEAAAYAAEVTWAVTCARFDAAVLAQLKEVKKIAMPEIAMVMRELRQHRRPILNAATYPLIFEPIVAKRDLAARVNLSHGGKHLTTWELADARQHVNHVMEVSAGVDMDAAYLRYLRGSLDLPEGTARAMVMDLSRHLHEPE